MSDIQEQVELETIETTQDLVMGEAWLRLQENPDFQTVIIEGYLKDKVLSSVSLLAVPQIKQEGRRPDIMEDLIAASNLKYHFKTIEHFYEGAKNPTLSDEEEAELEAEMNAEGTH